MRKYTSFILLALLITLIFPYQTFSAEDNYLISKEPIYLTIHMNIEGNYSFKDNWPVFREISSLTNVFLKGTAPSTATNSEEVFNLMISSGKLADIVHYQREGLVYYGMKGAFVPLNNLLEDYAPNFNDFLSKRPDVKNMITSADGNIYYIPHVRDGQVRLGWFIRQDWLDKLGLERPDTVNDFYQVLKAFYERDPNGNGLKDEIPLIARYAENLLNGLMIFWKARPGWFINNQDRVNYGPYTMEYKDAMKNIAKWYKEGLIDPQIYTRGTTSRTELLNDNRGGSIHDWFPSTSLFNEKLKDKISGFNLIPIAPPAGVDGIRRENTKRSIGGEEGWAISYSNPDPITTMKYFDFFWTERGRRMMNFGVEGLTYEMVDGQPVFKDWLLNAERNILDILFEDYGAQQEIGFWQDFKYEEQWMTPVALEGVRMYRDNNYMLDLFPYLAFTEEEYQRIYSILPDIESYVEEMRVKFILGSEDVEEGYDSYLLNLKEMGIEEVINIYQKAYQRYKDDINEKK